MHAFTNIYLYNDHCCQAVKLKLHLGCPIYHSTPVVKRHIAISLSVCLSVREHIFGTAGLTFTKVCVQIPCGRGSILLWRRCDSGAESYLSERLVVRLLCVTRTIYGMCLFVRPDTGLSVCYY